MSEFTEGMKRTAATMDGIDNSWNLLHIASQALAAMSGFVPSSEDDLVSIRLRAALMAKAALIYADAMLKEFRKTQGDDYGD